MDSGKRSQPLRCVCVKDRGQRGEMNTSVRRGCRERSQTQRFVGETEKGQRDYGVATSSRLLKIVGLLGEYRSLL